MSRFIRKIKIKPFLKFFSIFLLAFAWIFSGWPRIWNNPPIPPEVRETNAASPEAFATDGTFTPSNGIYAVDVECWGGGGGGGLVKNNGGGGGGGGAYVKSANISVTPGTPVAVDIGAGGASELAGADSTFGGTTVVADGGLAAVNNLNGTGGTTANSTGNAIESAGGDGGDGHTTGDVGAGGGGAGGPDGSGVTASNASASTSTAGGNGNNNIGTGTGGTIVDNGAGNPGNDDLTHGGGGGAGSENSNIGGAGGAPGGGGGGGGDNTAGGAGANGRCIVSYTDTWAPSISQTSYNNTWTFATAPNNDAGGQISMEATAGYDYNTISYSFAFSACASNGGTGGTSSGWQSADATYTDTGLDPNKCYGYTVQTKDSLENTGTASAASETYSSANVPGQPTLGSATVGTLTLTNSENSNPSENPTTYYAVYVSSTSPSDSNWYQKWVNGSGEPVSSEVWLTDAQLDGLVLGSGGTALAGGTTYGVKVKARNQNNDETSLSAEGVGETLAAVISITLEPGSGTVTYGLVATSKDTTGAENQTQTVRNNGNVNVDIDIKGQNSANWTLGASAGDATYKHEWCTSDCDGTPTWNAVTTTFDSDFLATNVAPDSTQNFDLKVTVPTSNQGTSQQNVDVFLLATQH